MNRSQIAATAVFMPLFWFRLDQLSNCAPGFPGERRLPFTKLVGFAADAFFVWILVPLHTGHPADLLGFVGALALSGSLVFFSEKRSGGQNRMALLPDHQSPG